MHWVRGAGWCCGVAALSAWAGLAGAQSGTSSGAAGSASQNSASTTANSRTGQPVPTFRTNANLVILDVVVRDKTRGGGQPVAGLKQSEFHVLENGKEQKVSVFEEHKSTEAVRASAPPSLPPHVYSDAPRYTITSAANVLLLDSMNTTLSDQVYVRTRMVKDLRMIPAGTEIAVFKLDRRLHILSGFTSDKDAIAKLIEKGPGLPENSPVNDPQFNRALSGLANLGAAAGASPLAQQNMMQVAGETREFEGNLQAELTMDAMTQLARYLSTIPGRKNLIWYTGTIPFSFPTGSAASASSMGSTYDMADFSGQMQKMMELLAVARVSVYPVDSRGLATRPHDWDHLRMDQMAAETGGKAFYNTNGVGEALPEAIANGSDYYTLAYAPSDGKYDGALRRIDVKLSDNENYDLEYRRGYFADDPSKRDQLMAGRTNPLIDAMQHGSLELSQVNFEVRVLPVGDSALAGEKPTMQRTVLVPKGMKHPVHYMVDYWVDPRGLGEKAAADGKQERDLEVTQVAYNDEGIRENYTDMPLGVPMSDAESQKALTDGIQLHQEIDLPPGKNFLRIGVRDILTGEIGTVEIPVDVEKGGD
jgi:VWFA-related protein